MSHAREVDLSGRWRFRTDPENLGEHFPEQLDIPYQFDARWMRADYDASAWATIQVPACWQAEGHNYNGAAWYRTTFARPEADRVWLRFEGVDYFADVWLNERCLGSHEGYFSAFQFEITDYLHAGDNVLAVRVDSPNDINAKETQRGQLKGLIKGALQRWDVNNPDVNPGGIWNAVTLTLTGPVAITAAHIRTHLTELPPLNDLSQPIPATAVIGVEVAGSPQPVAGEVILHVAVQPLHPSAGHDGPRVEAVLPITLIPAPTTWTIPVEIEAARLWFTWDLGEPQLYEAVIRVEVNGAPSDEIRQTFGFRRLERRAGWVMTLNGVRFFQRGANYLSDQLLSTMTAERYARDVALMCEANLNTVHPFAVVEKRAFYDACDRAGVLVYQDFPMWLTMNNGSDLVRRAVAQLTELIAQFGHHPSLAIWNFGSQPSEANFLKLGAALATAARELDPGRITHQANALIEPQAAQYDPVDDYKWDWPTAQAFQRQFDWRVDTHQYQGWYWGPLENLNAVPIERLELVTEYGAQALPERTRLEAMMSASALWPPDWPHYTRRCFQPEYQFQFILEPASLEQFIADSQNYQARFIQYHTEHYRRLKFAPCNGAHLFCFNDCWNAITWSVVDYERNRKPGFHELRRAMAPLQVLAEFAGSDVALWLVNDYPRAFDALQLRWTIVAGDSVLDTGERSCSVAANTLERLGGFSLRHLPPNLRIQFEIVHAEAILAENVYTLPAA